MLTSTREKGGDKFHYVNVGSTNAQGAFVTHKTFGFKKDAELLFRVYENKKKDANKRGTASVGIIPGDTKQEDMYISAVERAGPSTNVRDQNRRVTTDLPFKTRHHSGKLF